MIFVPIIVVVIFAIAFAPTGGRRSYRRRKYKGLLGLANDMERSRKKRGRHLTMQ
jgi:hypothetical protein